MSNRERANACARRARANIANSAIEPLRGSLTRRRCSYSFAYKSLPLLLLLLPIRMHTTHLSRAINLPLHHCLLAAGEISRQLIAFPQGKSQRHRTHTRAHCNMPRSTLCLSFLTSPRRQSERACACDRAHHRAHKPRPACAPSPGYIGRASDRACCPLWARRENSHPLQYSPFHILQARLSSAVTNHCGRAAGESWGFFVLACSLAPRSCTISDAYRMLFAKLSPKSAGVLGWNNDTARGIRVPYRRYILPLKVTMLPLLMADGEHACPCG
jgi:hypothetical protein